MTITRNQRVLDRASRLYKSKAAASQRWNKKNAPLRQAVTLTHEELFKRDIYPTRKREAATALATTKGTRRIRQSTHNRAASLFPAASDVSTETAAAHSRHFRFPAKGRKAQSYDGFLRRQFSGKYIRDTNSVAHLREPLSTTSTLYAPSLTKIATHTTGYLTKQQRRVTSLGRQPGVKSRVVVTPLPRAEQVENQLSRARRSRRAAPLRGVARALMRQALLARFMLRQIRDLRGAALARQIKQRNTDPLWLIRKQERRNRKARRYTRYVKRDRRGHTKGQPGS